MGSPFPGMDPCLESHWGDVHTRVIMYSCDQIQPLLPRDLRARVQERVLLEPDEDEGREVYPDVRVVERPRPEPGAAGRAAAVDAAEPLVITLADERVQRSIEIVEVGSRDRVVTVIEVLSPTNKRPGMGQQKYIQKQEELAEARISLVEIDLLRAGRRILGDPALSIPASHRTAYQVCVHRGWQPIRFEVYRAPLRERLPKVRVPLRATDADVPLDLQAVIDQCYKNGRYEHDIDYRAEPDPPLSPDDAAWADALLREKGRR
jgi:hypothetical protein